jgi:hypothetical protein
LIHSFLRRIAATTTTTLGRLVVVAPCDFERQADEVVKDQSS